MLQCISFFLLSNIKIFPKSGYPRKSFFCGYMNFFLIALEKIITILWWRQKWLLLSAIPYSLSISMIFSIHYNFFFEARFICILRLFFFFSSNKTIWDDQDNLDLQFLQPMMPTKISAVYGYIWQDKSKQNRNEWRGNPKRAKAHAES